MKKRLYIVEREDRLNAGTHRESAAWRRTWPDYRTLGEAKAALKGRAALDASLGAASDKRYRIRERHETGRLVVVWAAR